MHEQDKNQNPEILPILSISVHISPRIGTSSIVRRPLTKTRVTNLRGSTPPNIFSQCSSRPRSQLSRAARKDQLR